MNDWIIDGRYDFSIPEAQRLSDLSSINSDLEAVIRICNRCEITSIELHKASPSLSWMEEQEVLGDLKFAAVIRYGRTIGSGVRQSIPLDWIEALPDSSREAHQYFKALRDKYVAHSVSQLEDNQVFVMLSPQFSEDQQPSHVTVDKGRLLTLGSGDIASLRTLAQELLKTVLREIELEKERLLMLARQMPLEKIKARGADSLPIPTSKHAFKIRRSFK